MSKEEVEGLFGKLERKGAVEDANSSAMGDLCADVGERLSQLEASLGEVRAAEEAARHLTRQGRRARTPCPTSRFRTLSPRCRPFMLTYIS